MNGISIGFLKEAGAFNELKKHKVPLSPEERAKVMNAKAVWHHGPHGEPTPAVWKAVRGGKTTFVTNTHRLWQKRPTLLGAIERYHKVVKATA